jgi:hypothetical protein
MAPGLGAPTTSGSSIDPGPLIHQSPNGFRAPDELLRTMKVQAF